MAATLPSNVYVSKHPCLRAKLSQLRSKSTNARETKTLVTEIATILGVESLASLEVSSSGTDTSPIGYDYQTETVSPSSITLVPIMRSGLGMLDALQSILPDAVSVHHLGLFRDPLSLQPVEYYNNLPFARPVSSTTPGQKTNTAAASLAILIDPVIATGGTAAAAIQTLKEWGVERVILISILGAHIGVTRAAEEWPEGTEVWVGAIDGELNDRGMIKPGLGDIGDRLFLTLGR